MPRKRGEAKTTKNSKTKTNAIVPPMKTCLSEAFCLAEYRPQCAQKSIPKSSLRDSGRQGVPPQAAEAPLTHKRHLKLLKSNRQYHEKEGTQRQAQTQTQKKRDSSPYEDTFFGSIFLGRVPAGVRSKTQNKKNSDSSPLWMRVCQRPIYRQSTGPCALE